MVLKVSAYFGPVAQLVRASPCHGEGHEFESRLGRKSLLTYIVHLKFEDSYSVFLWDLSSAGRASALQAEGHRFEPYRSHLFLFSECADVAQLAEQLICNQQVIGSSPIIGFIWVDSRVAKGDRL